MVDSNAITMIRVGKTIGLLSMIVCIAAFFYWLYIGLETPNSRLREVERLNKDLIWIIAVSLFAALGGALLAQAGARRIKEVPETRNASMS